MRPDKGEPRRGQPADLSFYGPFSRLFLQTSVLCAPGCLVVFKFIIPRASSQSKVSMIIVTQGHGTRFGKHCPSENLSHGEQGFVLYPRSPELYLAHKVFVELDVYLWVHPADLAVHTHTPGSALGCTYSHVPT